MKKEENLSLNLSFEIETERFKSGGSSKLMMMCPDSISLLIETFKETKYEKTIKVDSIFPGKKNFVMNFPNCSLEKYIKVTFKLFGDSTICANYKKFQPNELRQGCGFTVSNIKLTTTQPPPPEPCDNSQAKLVAKLGAITCIPNDKEHIKAFVQLIASGLSDGDYMLVSEQTDPKMIFSKISVKGGKIENLKSELCQIKTGEVKLKLQKSDCKEVEASLKAERPNECDSLPRVLCEDCKSLSGTKTYRKEDSLKFYSDLEMILSDCADFCKIKKIVAIYKRYQDKSKPRFEQDKLEIKSAKNKNYYHYLLIDSLKIPKENVLIVADDTRNIFEINAEVNCDGKIVGASDDKIKKAVEKVLAHDPVKKVEKVYFYFYVRIDKRRDAEFQRKIRERAINRNAESENKFIKSGLTSDKIIYIQHHNPSEAMRVFFSDGISVVIDKEGNIK